MCPDATLDHLARPELLVLAAGEFGHAIARRLAAAADYTAQVVDISAGTHPIYWPYADLIALTTDAERPVIADAVDRHAHVRRIPWVPVHLRGNDIQAGPNVLPGRTACLGCYQRRRSQHGGAPIPRENPPAPTGYASHQVSLSAALALQALDDLRSGTGGVVRTVNVLTGSCGRSGVVGVDRCERCGGRFGDRVAERVAFFQAVDQAARPPVAGAALVGEVRADG